MNTQKNREQVIAECYQAARGAVVLLNARSKEACRKWKDISFTCEELSAHCRKGGNYGIQTGRMSGLDVLDIDAPENFSALVKGLKAYTPYTKTGRGYHFWFNHHPRVNKNKAAVVPGIDIRTTGGYVVAPGAIHESGAVYTLYGQLEHAREWPKKLLDRLFPLHEEERAQRKKVDTHVSTPTTHAALPPYVAAAFDSAVRQVQRTGQGQRNDTLNREAYSLAGFAHLGLDKEAAEEPLVSAAMAAGLSQSEAQTAFRSGWEHGLGAPRRLVKSTPRNAPVRPVKGAKAEVPTETRYMTPDGEIFARDEVHCVHTRDTNCDVAQGVNAVLAYNQQAINSTAKGDLSGNPAPFFNRGGLIVHLHPDQNKLCNTLPELFNTILDGKAAKWYSPVATKAQPAYADNCRIVRKAVPEPYVSKGVMAALLTGERSLPRINKVLNNPVFLPDGNLTTRTGYYPNPGLWYKPHDDYTQLELMPVDEAMHWLLEELLVDFPFASAADKANALAHLLLLFMRDMIPGPTPLFAIEAPTPGTGKSLLAECFSIIAMGDKVAPCSFGNDDEELRKHLTARLIDGPQLVMFDNLPAKRLIDRPSLAAVLTTTSWSDRILGRSETASFPISCVWTATGNNIQWSEELARRIVRIRIVAAVEKPWQRKTFKHDPLIPWVQANRLHLAGACISIIQNWIDTGQALAATRMGSFEAFAAIMGGVLESAGIDAFLENMDEFMSQANPEEAHWGSAFLIWAKAIGNDEESAKELLEILKEEDQELAETMLFKPDSVPVFGRMLGAKIDCVHNGFQLLARIVRGRRLYSFKRVDSDDDAAGNYAGNGCGTDDDEEELLF
ncbi:MAG: bifunctional DNA primase/polymerase [Candidatus Hydrogenedentales bacterium]|jgi:hypothetical protein